mmetsp:Transcript_29742/g.86679  ORF Transcript_29742/g.86679 Transcript_29742/m.86679 type:complete len:873 (-) Transcript_29742:2591-5209(-)
MTEACAENTDKPPENPKANRIDLSEYQKSFGGMIDAQGLQGKDYHDIPTKAQLMQGKFGRPDNDHSFTVEPIFEHILVPILKNKCLDDTSLRHLGNAHLLFGHLQKTLSRLKDLDFTRLAKTMLNYDKQEEIPMGKVMCFTAAALHFDLHIPSVIRYAGGNYTADFRDMDKIEKQLVGKVDPKDISDLRRVFTVGTPGRFVGESTKDNMLEYWRYGNHGSILKDISKVTKTMNKEDKHCYVVPMPNWLARFIPNSFYTPNGLISKAGKNDRLVFDGSHMINWFSNPVNKNFDMSKEPPVTYGRVLQEHINRIWNLRISYPNEDILLWDDDIAGCFRQEKHHPDVTPAFGLIIDMFLYFYVGQTFGSIFSPANNEPVRRAREQLAESLGEDLSIIDKHKDLLSKIKFSKPAKAGTKYCQAKKCSLNRGVIDDKGKVANTPLHTFVDDALMAEIRDRMMQAMANSIEALEIILGKPDTELRRAALSLEKFFKATCSPKKIQLGLQFNTRDMVIRITEEARKKIIKELKHWHKSRRSFTAIEAAKLVGNLQHLATVSQWARFLFSSLTHSVIYAIRRNKASLEVSSTKFQALSSMLVEAQAETNAKKALFAQAKIERLVWSKKDKYFVIPTMKSETKLLTHLLENPTLYRWESPIAHRAEKDPDSTTYGDACLYGGGGFSTDLGFWWQIDWPEEIMNRTLIHIKDGKSGKLISINVLEYLVVILNYAAATVAHQETVDKGTSDEEYPTNLNLVDNTSADAWTTKMCTKSKEAKSLALVLCSMMINNPVGLNSKYLPCTQNDIADAISRLHKANKMFEISQLMQDYPELRSCRRFHPSSKLLSRLYAAVLSGSAKEVVQQIEPNELGQLSPGKTTS